MLVFDLGLAWIRGLVMKTLTIVLCSVLISPLLLIWLSLVVNLGYSFYHEVINEDVACGSIAGDPWKVHDHYCNGKPYP